MAAVGWMHFPVSIWLMWSDTKQELCWFTGFTRCSGIYIDTLETEVQMWLLRGSQVWGSNFCQWIERTSHSQIHVNPYGTAEQLGNLGWVGYRQDRNGSIWEFRAEDTCGDLLIWRFQKKVGRGFIWLPPSLSQYTLRSHNYHARSTEPAAFTTVT